MPETKFTKKQILDKSIEIIKEKGLNALTARALAADLQSSVAPIYDNYGSIDGLKEAIFEQLVSIHLETLAVQYTDNYFFNVGIGTIKFAEEYKMVFQDYLLKRGNVISLSDDEDAKRKILSQMRKDKYNAHLSDEDLLDILMKMEIFTHGLSNMVSMEMFPENYCEEDIMRLLEETGHAIVFNKLSEKGLGGLLCKNLDERNKK